MTTATTASIAELNLFPVKSCRGISLDSGEVRTTGFDGDRHWLIVSDKGRYLSQRELPRMALISPTLTAGGLALNAPGMPALEVAGDSPGTLIDVAVILDYCTALDCGDVAADWLTQYFGRPVRLARFDPDTRRAIHPSFWKGGIDSGIEFSDAFPFLILSEASLADLNTRLSTPLPMNRFRPNIVLRGLRPYDEDRIHSLIVGDVMLQMVRPCTRCIIPTTNQATGEAQGPEPLATLKTYRWSKELRGAMFGQYAVVAAGAGGRLALDQQVVLVWK
ncbi:MAG TPA: MOSC N-terminal beta barrel domain-containing protein [Steroidobacter sp.]|uniref:MOSC domain-containing protein n=1 Tax=Steroidobacter sp. TaxID=1978227 RepID=UPI002EDB3A60